MNKYQIKATKAVTLASSILVEAPVERLFTSYLIVKISVANAFLDTNYIFVAIF
jgi:hypothetical protein